MNRRNLHRGMGPAPPMFLLLMFAAVVLASEQNYTRCVSCYDSDACEPDILLTLPIPMMNPFPMPSQPPSTPSIPTSGRLKESSEFFGTSTTTSLSKKTTKPPTATTSLSDSSTAKQQTTSTLTDAGDQFTTRKTETTTGRKTGSTSGGGARSASEAQEPTGTLTSTSTSDRTASASPNLSTATEPSHGTTTSEYLHSETPMKTVQPLTSEPITSQATMSATPKATSETRTTTTAVSKTEYSKPETLGSVMTDEFTKTTTVKLSGAFSGSVDTKVQRTSTSAETDTMAYTSSETSKLSNEWESEKTTTKSKNSEATTPLRFSTMKMDPKSTESVSLETHSDVSLTTYPISETASPAASSSRSSSASNSAATQPTEEQTITEELEKTVLYTAPTQGALEDTVRSTHFVTEPTATTESTGVKTVNTDDLTEGMSSGTTPYFALQTEPTTVSSTTEPTTVSSTSEATTVSSTSNKILTESSSISQRTEQTTTQPSTRTAGGETTEKTQTINGTSPTSTGYAARQSTLTVTETTTLDTALESARPSTSPVGAFTDAHTSATEKAAQTEDQKMVHQTLPSPTFTPSTEQQTAVSSTSAGTRPLTTRRPYQRTADRTVAEMFSKSIESAMRSTPKSTPTTKVSTTPITSKLPKQTTVANYVATTKSPVLLLETTQDRSLTTRVPDSVTFVNTFATAPPTTESRPEYCDQPCPDQFWDSGDMCYLLVPRPQSVSYIRAISYCQTVSDKTDMAWARDYVNATLNEQFTNMLNEAGITSLLVYYNEKGSKEFRANKKINATSLSEIDTKYYGILDFDDIINNQIINQKSDYVRNDVSSFCRTPRYCQKNRCAFSDFVDAGMAKVVGLPNGVDFLQEGDQVVLPCIQNDKAQTVRTRCSSYGTWVPHPSLLNCDPPAHPIEEEEVEFEGNPRLQTSCSACYKWGTDKCVRQENGLFQCVCKPGWTRFKCWKSPNMCANVTTECGAGKCRSLVDMYDCVCPVTFFGDKCQYNKTSMTLFGKNNTVAYVSWGTMGQITMTTTNLLLLLAKLCGKFTLIDDPEDPQETYCFLRKATLSAAGCVAVLWKNPQLLGVDSVSCRFFWTIINHLYTYALFMAANEAINFYTVMDGLSRNWWGNYEGKYTWYFSYRYRVYYAMFALVAFYGLISAVYWTNLVHSWTCLSSFVSPKDELWLLITCLMLTLGFFGSAFGEAGCLVMKTRPHGLIKVKAYFEHLWPCEKGILTKVIRNKFYAPLMPMVLFLQWYYLVRSTDEPSFYFDMMTFIVSAVYTVLNVFQTLHCSTGFVRTQYVIFAMCYLPKWMSPEYEEESWRNRDEVLAKYRPRRYAREQQEKEDAIKAEKEKERDMIRKNNQELLKKTPNLPQRLLYHVPEDGPEQCETVSLEMDMTLDCYIPDYKKKVFERRWTRMYLEYRMRAYTVKDSIARVLMEEMRRGLLKKHGAVHEMEIRLYNHWCHTVPDRDHINVRNPHQDRVFIMPEGPPDRLFLMKFDRLINRVVNAARQGLFMPVRPRQLPENPDVREFKQVLDFMKWQFPNKLDTLDFETADANMHPQEQTFLKGADIVIEEQFEDWDAKLKEAMEIENEKFDKVYEDDVCFSQYIGTPFEEHAREIFNVQPKFCPDGERLANPRNRPIDNHFQDDLMPGFIGPAPRSRVNLGPYDEFVKKAAYYQGIVDGEWDAVRGNAAIQRRDRHMRTGRGEFEGNFDSNWRGKAKMYLWRLIAKDD